MITHFYNLVNIIENINDRSLYIINHRYFITVLHLSTGHQALIPFKTWVEIIF